jgi:hypothetical protein
MRFDVFCAKVKRCRLSVSKIDLDCIVSVDELLEMIKPIERKFV